MANTTPCSLLSILLSLLLLLLLLLPLPADADVIVRSVSESAFLPLPSPAALYGTQVTWTVVTVTRTVNANTAGIPITAATVMAVVTAITTTVGASPDTTITTTKTIWPLPSLTVNLSERIRITLVNNVAASTEMVTLHFHGILQDAGYAAMDGPEDVVQCGQAPNSGTFIYDFQATRAGTFWMHSHDPGQYPKGLRGPLIIKNPNDKDKYAEEFIATVSDWYADFWGAESRYLNGQTSAVGIEATPDACIFNDYVPGVNLDAPTAVKGYKVGSNKSYRLRFINLSAVYPFYIKIEEHAVYVVEVDGVAISSYGPTDGFSITPGQRVSVSLTSMTRTSGKYKILAVADGSINSNFGVSKAFTFSCISYDSDDTCDKASANLDMFQRYSIDTDDVVRARPQLNNKPKIPFGDDGHTSVAYPWNFNERLFVPLDGSDRPSKSTLMGVKPGNIHWINLQDASGWGSMDGELWDRPDMPGLVTALRSTNTNFENPASYGSASNSIVVKEKGDVVWLIFATLQGDHPIHLHGHDFQILYKGSEPLIRIVTIPYRAAVDAFNSGNTNDVNWINFQAAVAAKTPERPPARDTIQAELEQLLIVAFVADNPGVWALHCHNDFHAKKGMFRQIIEAPGKLRQTLGTWQPSVPQGPNGKSYEFTEGNGGYSSIAMEAWQRNVLQCSPA